jgi:hypothetical protein
LIEVLKLAVDSQKGSMRGNSWYAGSVGRTRTYDPVVNSYLKGVNLFLGRIK